MDKAMESNGKRIEILTGRYETGSPDDRRIIQSIFGHEMAERRFALYFHWYNLMHELGHGILRFNCESHPHPVDEEQLVNDFAVAYWNRYGEQDKRDELRAIVAYALDHLHCPANADTTHIQYAMEKWGTEELNTFNNYGWFQFSCVQIALNRAQTLNEVLPRMGIGSIRVQPRETFIYDPSRSDSAPKVTADAVSVLRKWGVVLPDCTVTYVDDPNCHMCRTVDS